MKTPADYTPVQYEAAFLAAAEVGKGRDVLDGILRLYASAHPQECRDFMDSLRLALRLVEAGVTAEDLQGPSENTRSEGVDGSSTAGLVCNTRGPAGGPPTERTAP